MEIVAHALCIMLRLRVLLDGPALRRVAIARPQIDLPSVCLLIAVQIDAKSAIRSMHNVVALHAPYLRFVAVDFPEIDLCTLLVSVAM